VFKSARSIPHPVTSSNSSTPRGTWTAFRTLVWLFAIPITIVGRGYGIQRQRRRRSGVVRPKWLQLEEPNEDGAVQDAVWESDQGIDSLGWMCRIPIPLSQMRYSEDRAHTFGFTIDRDIYRFSGG
jgi:hypothetical protein